MNPLKQYRIGFVGLGLGKHRFSFEIIPAFFESFPQPAFDKGAILLMLDLEKTNNMLALHFQFSGEVFLTCDRCMEDYPQTLGFSRDLLVKFGEEYAEISDDIVVIPSTETHFDVAQYVYEFIHLGLPVRHVHPDDASGEWGCSPEALEKLKRYLDNNRSGDDKSKTSSPFDSLQKLRFN